MSDVICHMPVTVRIAGAVKDEQLDELEAVVERAVAERLMFVRRELEGRLYVRRPDTRKTPWTGGDLSEELDSERLGSDGSSYEIPSFRGRGAPVKVRVQPAASTADLRSGPSD